MQVKSVSGVSCYYETATNDQTIPQPTRGAQQSTYPVRNFDLTAIL